MLNEIPPYRICNAVTQKEIDMAKLLWPKIKIKLEETWPELTFELDKDFNLYYDHLHTTATKDQILTVMGTIYKEHCMNLLKQYGKK